MWSRTHTVCMAARAVFALPLVSPAKKHPSLSLQGSSLSELSGGRLPAMELWKKEKIGFKYKFVWQKSIIIFRKVLTQTHCVIKMILDTLFDYICRIKSMLGLSRKQNIVYGSKQYWNLCVLFYCYFTITKSVYFTEGIYFTLFFGSMIICNNYAGNILWPIPKFCGMNKQHTNVWVYLRLMVVNANRNF